MRRMTAVCSLSGNTALSSSLNHLYSSRDEGLLSMSLIAFSSACEILEKGELESLPSSLIDSLLVAVVTALNVSVAIFL